MSEKLLKEWLQTLQFTVSELKQLNLDGKPLFHACVARLNKLAADMATCITSEAAVPAPIPEPAIAEEDRPA